MSKQRKTLADDFRATFGDQRIKDILQGLGRHSDAASAMEEANESARLVFALYEFVAFDCFRDGHCALSEEDVRKFLVSRVKELGKYAVPMPSAEAARSGKFHFFLDGE